MKTEQDVQNLTRLVIQQHGGVAWRNNRGALPREDGVPIRFGLGNDSSNIDKVFKTGDLVGLYPDPIGMTPVGVFCMWECKSPGWRWSGSDHERAQLNAISFVRERGGRAGFVTHPDEAIAIMRAVDYRGFSRWGAWSVCHGS